MRKLVSALALVILVIAPIARAEDKPQDSPAVTEAIAQGDALFAHKQYPKAMDAYRKADKLSKHNCAACYLRLFKVERQVGDLSAALDDAKHAVKEAGDDKALAMQAHLLRGTLLAQMAGKPSDKKLKEAEQEFREVLAIDPAQWTAQLNLGITLLKQERDADGIAELSKYIAMPGANPQRIAEARRMIADPIRAREPYAPDFSVSAMDGTAISNSGLRGKVVLLDFWATWCGPCRESVGTIASLRKKYADRPFEIVGISSDNDEDGWRHFVAEHHMDWPQYIDLSERMLNLFDIHSFPTYVVIDREGIVRFRQSGFGSDTDMNIEEAVNKSLKRPYNPQPAPAAPAASVSSGTSPTAVSASSNPTPSN
jgi:cytochrome c biogenesis protein CcmG/thiol:disulfide interchange protein DsbE